MWRLRRVLEQSQVPAHAGARPSREATLNLLILPACAGWARSSAVVMNLHWMALEVCLAVTLTRPLACYGTLSRQRDQVRVTDSVNNLLANLSTVASTCLALLRMLARSTNSKSPCQLPAMSIHAALRACCCSRSLALELSNACSSADTIQT